MNCLARVALVLPSLVLLAPLAWAQYTFTGPSKCVSCHDHDRQATKWQKEEPAQFLAKAHFNTRKQLEGPKATAFAKAIGQADPYDLKGSCVKCHATVFRGDANAGVSCESCHGASSGYLDVHQTKGAYQKSTALGMRDLREKPAVIAQLCVNCHVTTDKRLGAAGHPVGDRFDAGLNLQKIVHWNTAYNFALVSSAGRTAIASRLGSVGGPPPVATATPAPAASAPAPKTPSGVKTPPSVVPPASEPAKGPGPPATPAPPTSPPAPWDWDQPIRPLPADYVPEAPPPVEAPSLGSAPRQPPRPAPPPRPSIAEDSPLPRSVPGLPDATTPALAPAPAAPSPPTPPSPELRVSELKGKGASVLERLLRQGARAPDLPPPAKPVEFAGPDSELLRLQDEVLALALEALRRPKP